MTKKVDLHGVKHENVQTELDKFYWQMMNTGEPYVEVITGISDKMKAIVKSVSKDYGFKVEDSLINPGSLIVRIK